MKNFSTRISSGNARSFSARTPKSMYVENLFLSCRKVRGRKRRRARHDNIIGGICFDDAARFRPRTAKRTDATPPSRFRRMTGSRAQLMPPRRRLVGRTHCLGPRSAAISRLDCRHTAKHAKAGLASHTHDKYYAIRIPYRLLIIIMMIIHTACL